MQISPKVEPGRYAFIVIEKTKKIQCPCCYEQKTLLPIAYKIKRLLVLKVIAAIHLDSIPYFMFALHKHASSVPSDEIFLSLEEAKIEVRRLRRVAAQELKSSRKQLKWRVENKTNWKPMS